MSELPKYVGMYRGRDWITTIEWSREELDQILDAAMDLKKKFRERVEHPYLKGKTLFLIFYNRSLRTRNSFEAGMTQLGGHAHFLDPHDAIYTPALPGDEIAYTTERIADVARVLSRYGDGIAIRIYGKHAKWIYGRGNRIIREFARWADVPVINMECDMYHPCQAMADIMTIKEKLGKVEGKKFVMSWAYTPSVEKPLAVPQSAVLVATRFGMDVVLAHPKGFDLDPKVIEQCKKYADEFGGSFEIVHDMKAAFEGADVVYPKSWLSLNYIPPKASKPDFDGMKELFEKNRDWICDSEKLEVAKRDVIYMHCLPADRGYEVTDEVIDGPHSVVFDQAENRLHVQKAIMSMIMG